MKIEDFRIGGKYKKIAGYHNIGEIAECISGNSNMGFNLRYTDGTSGYCLYNPENWEPVEPVEYEPTTGEKVHMCQPDSAEYIYIGKTADGRVITQKAGFEGEPLVAHTHVFIWDKGDKPFQIKKEVVTELTLAEIADKFDIDVKNIRIKEGN